MSSTGGKKSIQSPAPLTLSEKNEVRPSPIKNSITIPSKIDVDQTSYHEKLNAIRNKIFTEETPNIWNQAPPAEIGFEQAKFILGSDQMLDTNRCTPPKIIDTEELFFIETEDVVPQDYHFDDDTSVPENMGEDAENADTAISAPKRGLPFSPETHIRVRTIPHPYNPKIGDIPGSDTKEGFCWIQRDAIQHYLHIQKIEERRKFTKGAVYRTLKNDS